MVAVRGNPLFTEVGNVNLMAQINDALNTSTCRLTQAPAAVLKLGVASGSGSRGGRGQLGPGNDWQCTSWPAGVSHFV